MDRITKAVAEVAPADDDDAPNGAFDVILSAQTLDRDGEILKADEWKQPLPDHITFDIDHGMDVATTVGSGKPFINDDGNLQVRGTFSSIPRAQEVRTLVNEGHINSTSVAFLESHNQKDNKVTRELLNGAFVAVPSNREALVLSSKSADSDSIINVATGLPDDTLIAELENRGYEIKSLSVDTADKSAQATENKSADSPRENSPAESADELHEFANALLTSILDVEISFIENSLEDLQNV